MEKLVETLIGRLEELRKLEDDMIVGYCQSTISKAIEIVNELTEEYNNGWIPCSERLPECENGCETKALLFQIKETDTIWCGYYGEGGKYRDKYFRPYTNATEGFDARDIIAWQPLPAPYKEGCE